MGPCIKKENVNIAASYRGISLLNMAYKIYAGIISDRLRKTIEKKRILPDTEAGFREGRGTMDNAYILQHVVERS